MTFDETLRCYAEAVFNKDIEKFLSIYDNHVYIFDTWNQWMINGINALNKMVEVWFGSLGKEKVSVTFTQLNTNESEGQTVWIGEVAYTAIDENNKIIRSISNRMTWVMKKGNDGFKIIHEHSSLPIDMESFSGILK